MKMTKQQTKELLTPLAMFFVNNYTLSNSGSSNIKLNSSTYTLVQFKKKFEKDKELIIKHLGGGLEWFKIVDGVKKAIGVKEDDKAEDLIQEKLFEGLKFKVNKQQREKVSKVDHDSDIFRYNFNWTNHFPFIDLATNKALMYDDKHKCVDHSVAYKTWEGYLKTLRGKEREIVQENIAYGRIVYDPRDKEEIYQVKELNGETFTYLNAHKMPEWRKKDIKEPKLPKMFVELMEHLFPGKECREYVYHWLNFMMTSRNHCYLLLHGEQGIGKNTLTSVIQKLVGFSNFSYVNPSYWDDDKFNSELKYKRCVFFDETVVERSNTTSLRSYTNAQIAITEKGIDTKVYDNYASFVIANNLDKINHVLYDDRRFSVPVLGKEPIKKVYGQEWLDEFYDKVENNENDEFIAQIGHWILKYGDMGKYNEKQPYLTDSFYHIVEKALTQWQQFLVNTIESCETKEFYYEEFEDKMKNTGRVKVENFLNSHLDRDGESYGYVKQDSSGKRYIMVNEKYWPKEEETSEEVSNFDELEF